MRKFQYIYIGNCLRRKGLRGKKGNSKPPTALAGAARDGKLWGKDGAERCAEAVIAVRRGLDSGFEVSKKR